MTAQEILGDQLLVITFGGLLSDIRFSLGPLYHDIRQYCHDEWNVRLPIIHNVFTEAGDGDLGGCQVSIMGKVVARQSFVDTGSSENGSDAQNDDEFDFSDDDYSVDAIHAFIREAIISNAEAFKGIDWDSAILEVEQEGSITAYRVLSEYYGCVLHDDKKRFHYLKKGAALDSPTALLSLRTCYQNGEGTDKDPIAVRKVEKMLESPFARGFHVQF